MGTEKIEIEDKQEVNVDIKQIIESIEYYEKELSSHGKYSDITAGFVYDLFEKYENTQNKNPS